MSFRIFSKSPIILCLAIFASLRLSAQDPNLASQYFANGEFEKAATIFEQLFEKDNRNDFYFGRYFDCLLNLEQYDDCEKLLKKQIKKNPENTNFYVAYGNLYEKLEKPKEAKEQFEKAVDKMAQDANAVNRLANTFMNASKYDLAIKTYEKGTAMFNDPYRFAFSLGELYRRKNDIPKMLENYLNSIQDDPNKLMSVQTMLQRYLAIEDFTELQSQLYARLQADESNTEFTELLAWSFIQQKDYKSALRQVKALDKRTADNGIKVMKLGRDAADARDYETAIAAFDYILTEKGEGNALYFDAKQEIMNCRRKKLTEGFSYTVEDLRLLENEYETFLNRYGKGKQTAAIISEMADLEAFYINDLDKAISLLNELINFPGLDRNTLAKGKISLADFYLMKSEVWDATLLYSQVDKEFKEEQLGQEARFKNARLAYFNGDFQWSQAQFDVLKASTSKLISNDALDLSVFIMDNLNLDTTAEALTLYSQAELLNFQNRFPEAFAKLDTLRLRFPDHSLIDDILYLEAQIYEKKREFPKALELYQKVVDKDPKDIRADNSLYKMAQIYELMLHDNDKAKAIYEKIFMDYSGSVFAVEARKRFRVLRGDKLQ